jgi:hypothetical protein
MMIRPLATLFLLVTLCGCAAYRAPGFYGGDGTSMGQAVEIVGYDYTSFVWISEHYPGSVILSEELAIHPVSGRRYDLITFRTTQGETIQAYFLRSSGPGG